MVRKKKYVLTCSAVSVILTFFFSKQKLEIHRDKNDSLITDLSRKAVENEQFLEKEKSETETAFKRNKILVNRSHQHKVQYDGFCGKLNDFFLMCFDVF